MGSFGLLFLSVLTVGTFLAPGLAVQGGSDEEFGPVVRAYLGYLKSEQEVVDDRVSRHEVSRVYFRRNSNRIRALRQMAIRIARESGNDYLPELEAIARDEFGTLFERAPRPDALRIGDVYQNTFRYLGSVNANELFYIFARLDPYEQAELVEKKPTTGADDSSEGADRNTRAFKP